MEIAYTKYGVFWDPPDAVVDFIQSWKQAVRLVEPNAVYLNHPVHSTFFLWMADANEENKMISSLISVCSAISSFTLSFSGWQIFTADAATGGDTLTIGITPAEGLFYFQQKIASSMLQFKKQAVNYPVAWQGDFLESMQQWGFPFVGEHWLPHISIASVSGEGKKIITAALQSNIQPAQVLCNNVSLYKITDDTHTCLQTIQLL